MSRRRRILCRTLLIFGVSLTFGLFTTVTIACASSLFIQADWYHAPGKIVFLSGFTNARRSDLKTLKRIEFNFSCGENVGDYWANEPAWRRGLSQRARAVFQELCSGHPGWPWWAGMPSFRCDDKEVWIGTVQEVRGWPLPALRSEWTCDAVDAKFWGPGAVYKPASPQVSLPSSAAASRSFDPSDSHFLRSLPLTPIWRGLLADSFLFGLLPFAYLGTRHVRQQRRQLNGCCPKCAYDLRNNLSVGCPECGWNRPTPTTSG